MKQKYLSWCRYMIILSIFIFPILVLASAQNYFHEGMQWMGKGFSTAYPNGGEYWVLYQICRQSDNEQLSLYRYSFSDQTGDNSVFICYIKTEGDKVYFNQYDDSIPKWNLMYDFGLKPGEGCYIYSPLNYNLKRPRKPVREYMVCTDIHPDPDNPGWEIMEMEVYDEEDTQKPWDKGKWIKGLGSERWIERSNGFNLAGGGSELIQVYDNDKLIYSKIKDEK